MTSFAERERLTAEQERNAGEARTASPNCNTAQGVDRPAEQAAKPRQTLFGRAGQPDPDLGFARLQAGVSLYRALGGGWTVATDPNAPADRFSPLHYFPIVEAITGGG